MKAKNLFLAAVLGLVVLTDLLLQTDLLKRAMWHREEQSLTAPAPAHNRTITMINRSGRHSLPGNKTTSATKCSCGGWQTRWYYKGEPTPSCCLRQTAETAFSFIDFFQSENISYSPKGGSLVGIVRCGSLTAYEYDFDLVIYGHTQQTLKPLLQKWMKRENEPGGILARWGVTVGGLKFIRNGWGDFNPRTPRGDVHFDFGLEDKEPPGGFRPCSLYGRTLTCRGDADVALTKNYGMDWMTPRRWCKWDKLQLCDTRDEVEHEACIEARQEMREGPICQKHPDMLVGTTGCSGSDADEVLTVANATK